jgi:hypothetical protein
LQFNGEGEGFYFEARKTPHLTTVCGTLKNNFFSFSWPAQPD